mmetsp:Transcript_14360/g.34733  ORF Transcript_14360/g.34733 Transcript_14360/m.34733 type:complete len:138 (-) Transcript_14360:2268-2681(-)
MRRMIHSSARASSAAGDTSLVDSKDADENRQLGGGGNQPCSRAKSCRLKERNEHWTARRERGTGRAGSSWVATIHCEGILAIAERGLMMRGGHGGICSWSRNVEFETLKKQRTIAWSSNERYHDVGLTPSVDVCLHS